MKILALDTSCMMGSVAIIDGENLVAEQVLNVNVTHSERLIPSIQSVLDVSGLKLNEIDSFAVAIGPGSFTGLRIGLAVVKGFAFSLEKTVVGVSSLKALAYNMYGSDVPIISLLDARRGEYYIGINRFKDGVLETILDDDVLPPDLVVKEIQKLETKAIVVGDGVVRMKDLIEKDLKGKVEIPPPNKLHPHASNVAYLALKKIKADGPDDIGTLVPNYIRKSDAELVASC